MIIVLIISWIKKLLLKIKLVKLTITYIIVGVLREGQE